MVEQLGSGGADDEMLATALTHKALASAGLGKVDDALWYWYIAQAIYPAAAKLDMSSFGAPGEFLKRHPVSRAEPATRGKVTPAHVIKQVLPKFPAGASRFGIAGDLVVRAVSDTQGHAGAQGVSYAADIIGIATAGSVAVVTVAPTLRSAIEGASQVHLAGSLILE